MPKFCKLLKQLKLILLYVTGVITSLNTFFILCDYEMFKWLLQVLIAEWTRRPIRSMSGICREGGGASSPKHGYLTFTWNFPRPCLPHTPSSEAANGKIYVMAWSRDSGACVRMFSRPKSQLSERLLHLIIVLINYDTQLLLNATAAVCLTCL